MSSSFPVTRRRLLQSGAGAFALGLLGTRAAWAQDDYPGKSIRFIVGPGPDILARMVGEKLQQTWTQAVVIDQRPAAGGIVAGDAVAKAPPDGYTLLLSTGSYTINSALRVKSPYDFTKDLMPVSLMATLPFILVVSSTLKVHSLRDLVEFARARPGTLNFASSGNGTPAHLAGEMLKQMAKIDILHVPYKGAAAGVTDVMGGQVQMMFVPAPTALQLVETGRLQALAVSSPKRYFALNKVPTVAEQGYPDFAVVGWNGIHLPAKTPTAVADKLNREVARILRLPDVRERAMAAGFEPIGSTSDEFKAFVAADIARATAVIRAGNIQAE
ncbi:MAG: tripartite tricarboxylate transporter substrate binding protein [Rhizobacter sp.]|nr:tripartite tricarboxylate transporter substrate binding protein [Rhizobacter sp.]